jgi:hypothetical protein
MSAKRERLIVLRTLGGQGCPRSVKIFFVAAALPSA